MGFCPDLPRLGIPTDMWPKRTNEKEIERQIFFYILCLVCTLKHCRSGIYTCIVGKIQSTQNGLKSPWQRKTMSTRWDTTCAIFFSLPMEFHCHYEKTTAWNLICNPFANSMKRWIFRSYLAKCLSRCHMMSLDKNGKRLPFNVPFYPELFYLLLFAFITAHGRSSLLRTIRINSQSTIWITQDCFLLDFQSVARRTRISTYIMDMERVNKKCGGETFSDLHLRWIKKKRDAFVFCFGCPLSLYHLKLKASENK